MMLGLFQDDCGFRTGCCYKLCCGGFQSFRIEDPPSFGWGMGLFLPRVELGKSTFAGLPKTVVQIDTGFLHGTADHIVADAAGAGKEIT